MWRDDVTQPFVLYLLPGNVFFSSSSRLQYEIFFFYMQKRNEFQQSWEQKKRNNLVSPRCTQWCSNRKFHIRSITMFQTQNMRFSSRWFLFCGCYFRVVFDVAHSSNFISDLKAIKQICSGKTIAYVLQCQDDEKKLARYTHFYHPQWWRHDFFYMMMVNINEMFDLFTVELLNKQC